MTRSPTLIATSLVALLGAIADAPCGETFAPRTDGPFNVLEWTDGVTTSRSGYAVWVSVTSTHHRAGLPGYDREVGPPEHRAVLRVACRAPGGALEEQFPPSAPHGSIYLANHPDDPGVYTVGNPMYWILALTGREEERWPVEVQLGKAASIPSTLVRARINYSAPRPGLDIAAPGRALLDAIGSGEPITVEAEGPGVRLTGQFAPPDNARRAAALMREACM